MDDPPGQHPDGGQFLVVANLLLTPSKLLKGVIHIPEIPGLHPQLPPLPSLTVDHGAAGQNQDADHSRQHSQMTHVGDLRIHGRAVGKHGGYIPGDPVQIHPGEGGHQLRGRHYIVGVLRIDAAPLLHAILGIQHGAKGLIPGICVEALQIPPVVKSDHLLPRMEDHRPVSVLDHDVAAALRAQLLHVLPVNLPQIHDGDHRPQITAAPVNIVGQNYAVLSVQQPHQLADPGDIRVPIPGQIQINAVCQTHKGVFVVVENRLPRRIQHVDAGQPLLGGLHVGENILLHGTVIPGLIVRLKAVLKPGGPGEDVHLPQLLGEKILKIHGDCPGDQQQVFLALLPHHRHVGGVGHPRQVDGQQNQRPDQPYGKLFSVSPQPVHPDPPLSPRLLSPPSPLRSLPQNVSAERTPCPLHEGIFHVQLFPAGRAAVHGLLKQIRSKKHAQGCRPPARRKKEDAEEHCPDADGLYHRQADFNLKFSLSHSPLSFPRRHPAAGGRPDRATAAHCGRPQHTCPLPGLSRQKRVPRETRHPLSVKIPLKLCYYITSPRPFLQS